jgi:hypothetical protein
MLRVLNHNNRPSERLNGVLAAYFYLADHCKFANEIENGSS